MISLQKIKMMVKIFNLYIITVKSYKILTWHHYKITKAFYIHFVRLNLVFLTRFQKLHKSYESICSLVLQIKFSRKTCGLSFLSSVLQVWNLWRYSHVLPIAVLHYVSFRRCMFVHKHLLPHICYMMDVDSYLLVWKVVWPSL